MGAGATGERSGLISQRFGVRVPGAQYKGDKMKILTMYLKEVPEGYYNVLMENSRCLSPDKVYMISQITSSTTSSKDCTTSGSILKYFFRLPTKEHTYEALITEQLYEGICRDVKFSPDEIKTYSVFEYLFGKDTVRVYFEDDYIIAVGPEENKEWQYEFQKYHV